MENKVASVRTIALAAGLVLSGCSSITVTQPQVPPRAWASSGGMKGTPVYFSSTAAQPASAIPKLAFAMAKFEPHFSDDVPSEHGDEVGKGAGRGALTGVGACAQFIRAGLIGVPFAIACAPFGLVIGGVAGGANGAGTASALDQSAARSRLYWAAGSVDFHALTAGEISSYARSRGFVLAELSDEGPLNLGEAATYRGADRVVEVVISRVHVAAVVDGKASRVELSVRGRLVRADGWILDELSEKRQVELSGNQEDGGREIQRAVGAVAQAYVDKWVVGSAGRPQ